MANVYRSQPSQIFGLDEKCIFPKIDEINSCIELSEKKTIN